MLHLWDEFTWNEFLFKSKDFEFFKFIKSKSKSLFYKWNWRRLEAFSLDLVINERNDVFYYVIWELLTSYTCVGISRFQRRLMYIFVKNVTMMYKGIRHFLGLPVRGNRTWSNRKNPRKNQDFMFFYQQIYLPRRFGYFNKSRRKIVVYAEFLNKIYYLFFRIDWLTARIRRVSYINKENYLEWKFDLRGLLAHRIIISGEKKEKKIKRNKKKKQKKKYRIKKNLFNMGFDFNYSLSNEKKMFKNFFVTKRSFIPKNKKKKKK